MFLNVSALSFHSPGLDQIVTSSPCAAYVSNVMFAVLTAELSQLVLILLSTSHYHQSLCFMKREGLGISKAWSQICLTVSKICSSTFGQNVSYIKITSLKVKFSISFPRLKVMKIT
jgi:hypothetical protein